MPSLKTLVLLLLGAFFSRTTALASEGAVVYELGAELSTVSHVAKEATGNANNWHKLIVRNPKTGYAYSEDEYNQLPIGTLVEVPQELVKARGLVSAKSVAINVTATMAMLGHHHGHHASKCARVTVASSNQPREASISPVPVKLSDGSIYPFLTRPTEKPIKKWVHQRQVQLVFVGCFLFVFTAFTGAFSLAARVAGILDQFYPLSP
ncbi:MAG: hypothetical protein AAB792_01225 [Patescibacteria group bacterium]